MPTSESCCIECLQELTTTYCIADKYKNNVCKVFREAKMKKDRAELPIFEEKIELFDDDQF